MVGLYLTAKLLTDNGRSNDVTNYVCFVNQKICFNEQEKTFQY